MKGSELPFIPPRRLLLSGGGIRIISYLGVVQVLEERKLLKGIQEFCGVSAGGLAALLLALEYKMSIIERFCLEYDFGNLRNLEPESALEILDTYGLDSGEKIEILLKKILFHKGFGPNTTFGELAASGRAKSLRVWASDIQNLRPIEFSASKTPNMPIVLGLKASMSIPIYFMPVRHPETGTFLVDGGVFDNYPMCYLTEEEVKSSIGVTFEYSKFPIEVHDISSFLSLLMAGYYKPSYQRFLRSHMERTIIIPCQEYSSMDFDMTPEIRRGLASLGRKSAEDFFKSKPRSQTLKTRRFSIG